jgi:hypothetical protein
MIEMDMADNDRIKLCERKSGSLLTEVRSAVYEHTNTAVSLKKCRLA